MRKTLLATSAIIAAAALSSQAMAEVKLELSGGAKFEMAFVGDDEGSAGTDGSHTSVDQGTSSTNIFFTATGNADNGLTYGYKLDMRAGATDQAAGVTDESYMFFSGNWGTVHFGMDDNVVDNQVVTGADVLAAASGFDGSIGIRGSHIGGAVGGPDLSTSEGDKGKLAYYSPSFGGFDVAVSWAPQAEASTGRSVGVDNVVGTAARYKGNFGDVGVTAGVGYIFGDEQEGNNDYEGLQAGFNLTFGAFSVGLGYTHDFDSGVATTSTQDTEEIWDFGVAYNYGAGSVSLGYLHAEEDDGANGEDEFDAFVVGVDYTVAEGLTAYGEVQWAESKDDSAAANADTYETTSLVLGTKISF